MGWLLAFFYALVFLGIIRKWKFLHAEKIPISFHYLVFAVKLLAGFGLWVLYTYYYTDRTTSDTFKYFDDAMVIFGALPENPDIYLRFIMGYELENPDLAPYFEQFVSWQSSYRYGIVNDNPTVIRANALIALFSFGYYPVHIVFMCFLSFVGGMGIYRFLSTFAKEVPVLLFATCFLLPTVLFWSSGVLKEPLLILGLGTMLFSMTRMLEFDWRYFAVFGLSCWLMLSMKPYVFLCAVPGVLVYFWMFFGSTRRWILKFAGLHALLLAIAVNADYFYKPGNLIYILTKKREDFYNVARDQKAGSTIELPEIENWWNWILHWPEALFTAYFRPGLWEINGLLFLIGAVENTLVLILLIWTLFTALQKPVKPTPVFLFSLSFVICLGILIGSTVPVLGAVIRYKMPGILFLVAMCIPALSVLWGRFNLKNT